MYDINLIPLSSISETEEHDPSKAAILAKSIESKGVWTLPVVLEEESLAIMDGHHRFNAAKKLNFQRIPCVLLAYDSGSVSLKSWRPSWKPCISDVLKKIKRKQKFPYKTTRHLFDPPIQETSIIISLLS